MGRQFKDMDHIVFLHGFSGDIYDWDVINVEGFRHSQHSIIGHGWSGTDTWEHLANYDMTRVAQDLKVVGFRKKFHLVGYSMGGRLALYTALRYPEIIKSLTLISASPGLKTEAEREARRQADNTLADKIEANGIEWFVDYWGNLSLWDSQSPELKAELRLNRLQNNPIGLANSLRGMGTGVMPSLWDKLPDLAMPVQLIVGDLDTKFVAINQEMAELIPNVTLTIIEDAGHAVHLEKPDEVNTSLDQFLNPHKT